MKLSKKNVIYVFALLIFVIYLFSANYIFNLLIVMDKEARVANITLPLKTKDIKFAIDKIEAVKLKWKDALFIQGWVFRENVKKEKRDVYIVLKSGNNTVIYKIEKDSLSRPDVSTAFHLAGGAHNHGFEAYIPLYRLTEDTCQMGFVIEDETGRYYSGADLELKVSNGNVSVIGLKSGSGSLPRSVSAQVSVNMVKPTKEVNYSFDVVEQDDQLLTLLGWGYLRGMDAAALKSYILLKKNENVFVYTIDVKTRKDVTSHFAQSGLNLDSSGFKAKIPVEKLEKGNYRLGLYIIKGNQTGMVYSDKYIEIGK